MKKYSLVLLTLNEIDGLKAVFNKIPVDQFDEVFAVDGGSTDGTLEFYKQHGIKIVPQESKGRGEAFRIASKVSRGDVFVFYSPDGNEDPGDLPKFKDYFEKGADIVIASRMMKGAHNEEDDEILKWRKWANNAFNLLANVFFRKTGSYITDSINGFRGITKEAFQKVQPDGRGYTIEYQMTIRAMKEQLKVVEFPTYEYSRVGGESYAKSIPTGIAFLKMLKHEMFRDGYIKKFQAVLAIIATFLTLFAVYTTFNPSQITSHPEYHRWIYQATKNGNFLKPIDFLRGFDPIAFDGWIRPRFIGYAVTVLNVKLRLLLYNFFIPPTTLSIQFLLALFLAPIFFFKFAKNLLRSGYLAFWATCLYITSVGFLSNFAFLFQPGKALAHVAAVLLYFLLSELLRNNRQFNLRSKKAIAVLILNFIGVSIDESYLIMSFLGIIIFWKLFWPVEYNLDEIKKTFMRLGLYFSPFLIFLIFVAVAAPEITAYIGAGKLDYIDWVAKKGQEMTAAPFMPLFYKMSYSSIVSSFAPLFLMGQKIPIMLKPVWEHKNETLFWIFSLFLIFFAIWRLAEYRKEKGDGKFSGNYFKYLTDVFVLVIVLYLIGQTFLSRYHPVVSGNYYYSSLFSIITPVLTVLLFGINRTYWRQCLGGIIIILIMAVQLVNFYDINSRWMLFHKQWIHLESINTFPELLRSDSLMVNADWIDIKQGLPHESNAHKAGLEKNYKKEKEIWVDWKRGAKYDLKNVSDMTDSDALFLHEMDVLMNNKKK